MPKPLPKAFGAAAATLLALSLLTSCASSPQQDEMVDGHQKVVLDFASAFPSSHPLNAGLWMLTDELEKSAPWIELRFRGGPEMMAPNLLIEGVSAGVVDGASLPGDYYVDQLPAMEIPRFTPFTPSEERAKGLVGIYNDIHREQLGVTYLGHSISGMPQVIMLKDKMASASMAGKAIRTSSATSGIVEALGGIPVDLPSSEIYTGLERSVVDGASFSSVGPAALGLPNVVKYDISPRFYESVGNIVINDATWDGLDAATQQALQTAMATVEPKIFDHFVGEAAKETKSWHQEGVQENVLPPQDAQKLLEVAYRKNWEELDWKRILSTSPEAQKVRDIYQPEFSGDLSDVVPAGTGVEGGKS